MSRSRLGQVAELWVFPVKSMSGASVERADLGAGGVSGDRSWAVVDEAGELVSAAQEPRLRDVVTRLIDGDLRLDVPGAQSGLAVDAAGKALSAWLGRPLVVAHREGTGFVDVAPVSVVSHGSIHEAVHDPEHAGHGDACDVEAPRSNLVLDLDDGVDGEQDWVGRSVTVGSATLSVVRRPKHCLGVYAEVSTPGAIRIGDEVREA